MDTTDRKSGNNKREVRRLGVIALVMAIIYTIPIVLMFFVESRALTTLGMGMIPIAIISYATARLNFWKPPATNIRIWYLGHMCFKLECDDQSVIIDPYKAGAIPGLKPVKESTNLVLCTDDENTGTEEIKVKKTKRPLRFEVTEYIPQNGKGRMYMLDNGDHKVVHLGALSCELTDEQKEAFTGVDVLFIPTGGKYALDEKQAAKLTLELMPEYAIPMFFRGPTYGMEDLGTGNMYGSEVRTAWIRTEGNEDTKCPVTIRLAAKRGKEKGLASVEVRNRDEAGKK